MTFQDVSVLTISSDEELPWTIKAVLIENCAQGFSSPKFQTVAAMAFLPGLSNGAISTLSYVQCSRSARAGPKHTGLPLTNNRYLLSAEMLIMNSFGCSFNSKSFRKWNTP